MSDIRRASKFFLVFLLVFINSSQADVVLGDVTYSLPYQWHMRKTSFYDAVQRQLFLGAISHNATSRFAVGVSSGAVVTSCAPNGLSETTFVKDGYETRPLWDMSLVYQGATPTPWLLQIVSNDAGTAPSSKMYVVKVDPADSTPTCFAHTQFNNNSDVASIPFKTCRVERASTDVSAANKNVFVVAIAGSSSDTTFNSTSSGACFRLYTINTAGTAITEFAASKLAASELGSFSELRDMWWDSQLKRLYCAFARTNETKVGICALYLDETTPASPVLKLVNDGELLSSPGSSAKSLIPYAHKVRTFVSNPADTDPDKRKYLLVCGGLDQYSYNRIYALPLLNANNPASAVQGKIDTKLNPGVSGSGVTAHDNSWLDQRNDVAALAAGRNAADSANLSLIDARTVGAGPLPISPETPVTDIQVIGLNVYVSVADDTGGPCLFKTQALVSYVDGSDEATAIAGQQGKLKGWTPWQQVVSSNLYSPITTFGIDAGSNRLMVLFDKNEAREFVASDFPTVEGGGFPVFEAYPQHSFSRVVPERLDIADLTSMWRGRHLGMYSSRYKVFYTGCANKEMGDKAFAGYLLGGEGSGLTRFQTAATGVVNQPIWTLSPHDAGVLVVPHSEIDAGNNLGGKRLYLLSPAGKLLTQNVAADVKDSASAESRMVQISFVPKATTRGIILAAIPQASTNVFASGNSNCVRAYTYDVSEGTGSDGRAIDVYTNISPYSGSTFVYSLASGSAALAVQTGQSGSALTYRSLEDMHSDPVSEITYLAFTKSSDGRNGDSNDDAGLVFIGWDSVGTAKRQSGKLLEGSVHNETGFKHMLKVRTLYTATDLQTPANNKPFLIFNGTNHIGLAEDGSGQSLVALNKIYALPLVAAGDHRGKIATDATHATAAVLASATWSEPASSGENYAKHVVGGAYLPTHPRSVVTDMLVSGRTVFVSVANPQGVAGRRGVFYSTALTDADNKLVGWTEWRCIGGGNQNIAALGYNSSTDTVVALNHDSSRIEEFSWRSHARVEAVNESRQNIYSFANALESDFSSASGKMYGLQLMSCVANNNQSATHFFGAFGHNKVALALCAKTLGTTDSGSIKYPHKLDASRYLMFGNDAELDQIKSIYCMALAPRLPGWVFVGGYRGLAVLRNGSNGRGWTSLPGSLADTNSGAYTALNAQTWKVLPGVVGPVYKVVITSTVIAGTSTFAPVVICMGKQGLTGFVATEGKFKDSSPTALATFNTAEIFTDPGEYMRDVALIGGRMFLVGTNKGLYLMQLSDTNDSFVASPRKILYQGAQMGPIGAIRVTTSASAEVSESNPTGLNGNWFVIDVITARLIKNQSEHYQFKIKLNDTGVLADSGLSPVSIKRSFTHVQGKLFASGNATYYTLPGKHLATGGAVRVVDSAVNDTAENPLVSVLKKDAPISDIAENVADGARVVTIDGCVYVYRA